jgi:hypothetical protein
MMRDPGELISAYFDDALADGELAELRAWLGADPARLRQFVRESVIHSRMRDVLVQHDMRGLVFDEFFGDMIDPQRIASLLDEEEAAEARRAREKEEQARRQAAAAARADEQLDRKLMRIEEPRTPKALVYACFAVAATLFLMIGRLIGTTPEPKPVSAVAKPPVNAPAERPVIAEVAKTLGATLVANEKPIDVGAKLHAGSFVVGRGVAEVSFAAGARIIVEGPAKLELLTAQHARIISGRVVANVPQQALGFTLHSDAASFVDLGTEFAVEVNSAGLTSVHVFDGEVALVSDKKSKTPSRTLQRGLASEIAADGSVRNIVFDESGFLRRVPSSAYELAVLKSRPLAYWRLDQLTANEALESEGRLAVRTVPSNGAAVADHSAAGVKLTVPRFAARFSGDHDGIDIAADAALGMVTKCTCEAWVLPSDAPIGPQRVFSTFDRPRSGLAIGVVNGYWYALPDNDLRFHLTTYGDYDCLSATSIRANEWVHLAATIDEGGIPALYVNGRPVSRRFRPSDVVGGSAAPAKTPVAWSADGPTPVGRTSGGVARIGRNPVGADGQISPERWAGEISNVAIYDRVLPPDEIRQHFEATRDAATDIEKPRPPAGL